MNIILIAIDTLSARHMSCYGYTRHTTPFIDEYAKDGVLFQSLYCQAIPTQPSYTSTYTGQYAITHGVVSHGGARNLDRGTPVLPEILQQNGYTTCAIDTLARQKEWFARGYEFCINPRGQGLSQTINYEQYNARAIPWLKSHANEKFFLFVHYWDPHADYFPPEQYRHLFYDGDPCDPKNRSLDDLWAPPYGDYFGKMWKTWFDKLIPGSEITDAEYIAALYDSEIRYVDNGVRELLGTLEQLDLTGETLVVIFSDHGEMMYKHGIYFDHMGLYDDDIHVPLIIRWPKIKQREMRVPHLVQHIDIAPTILDMTGIPVPDSMEGKSLLPYVNSELDEPIYPFLVVEECTRMMKWGIRTEQYKYILSREQDFRGGPMRELYDLMSDPHEMTNIVEECPDIAEKLEDKLEGWIASMMKKNSLTTDPLIANGLSMRPDSEWFEKLKKRGYW